MALFNFFDSFSEYLGRGRIDLQNDALKIVLTNVVPDAEEDVFYAHISEIAAGGGYPQGGLTVTAQIVAQDRPTYKLVLADRTLTATGTIATFRYAVLVDTTAAGQPLIGWWDYGESVNLTVGATVTFDFSAAAGVLQIRPTENPSPGVVGSPIGLLLALTVGTGGGGGTPAPGGIGSPIGLLLALTLGSGGGGSPDPDPAGVGSPIGLLLTLTLGTGSGSPPADATPVGLLLTLTVN